MTTTCENGGIGGVAGKSQTIDDDNNKQNNNLFLTISPALIPANYQQQLKGNGGHGNNNLAKNTRSNNNNSNNNGKINQDVALLQKVITNEQQRQHDGKSLYVCRGDKEKEKNPDRINLDRRGLIEVPIFDDDDKNRLRLLSLQHNMLTNLNGFDCQSFRTLVFLDIYDNQLDKINDNDLSSMENLRVLLLGKNR